MLFLTNEPANKAKISMLFGRIGCSIFSLLQSLRRMGF